jgi:hypothetical protein
MSTRNRKKKVSGGKAQLARKTNNLTAICEPITYTLWDPQHFTTLLASTACYGDSLAFTSVFPCNFSFFKLLHIHSTIENLFSPPDLSSVLYYNQQYKLLNILRHVVEN